MNLQKLFELQRQLDEHIEREHPRQEGEDRLAKKILALFVELGELANEHRGFKYWSNDQEPRTGGECSCDDGYIDVYMGHGVVEQDICPRCEGIGELPNTLIEEYVDALHFILSIGLDIAEPDIVNLRDVDGKENIIEQFIEVFDRVRGLYFFEYDIFEYESLLAQFIKLGEMLGFSWDEVEEAYLRKNRENHQRQESGY
ncbi:dUTP diphosphatase [Saccharococcus caldoxylosilyticus]|uniref:Dimeric dUTPase n=1 Tax=Saccharococcus caldoxylosilyticus TaxID=81408 RepID=A0A150LJA7_9BACL|nr:dUTP diphosphatase [Parageobacillus caldoxylosilyticus]KYD12417.1 Dimeric dUTPase [Parageobacillus caldoxylosilyticus]